MDCQWTDSALTVTIMKGSIIQGTRTQAENESREEEGEEEEKGVESSEGSVKCFAVVPSFAHTSSQANLGR